jgi:hypothetical protein
MLSAIFMRVSAAIYNPNGEEGNRVIDGFSDG